MIHSSTKFLIYNLTVTLDAKDEWKVRERGVGGSGFKSGARRVSAHVSWPWIYVLLGRQDFASRRHVLELFLDRGLPQLNKHGPQKENQAC